MKTLNIKKLAGSLWGCLLQLVRIFPEPTQIKMRNLMHDDCRVKCATEMLKDAPTYPWVEERLRDLISECRTNAGRECISALLKTHLEWVGYCEHPLKSTLS